MLSRSPAILHSEKNVPWTFYDKPNAPRMVGDIYHKWDGQDRLLDWMYALEIISTGHLDHREYWKNPFEASNCCTYSTWNSKGKQASSSILKTMRLIECQFVSNSSKTGESKILRVQRPEVHNEQHSFPSSTCLTSSPINHDPTLMSSWAYVRRIDLAIQSKLRC